MKLRYIPLLFIPPLALAQQVDPSEAVQTFINEYNASSIAQSHVASRIAPLVNAFRDMEAQKATLIEWLKAAQAKEAK